MCYAFVFQILVWLMNYRADDIWIDIRMDIDTHRHTDGGNDSTRRSQQPSRKNQVYIYIYMLLIAFIHWYILLRSVNHTILDFPILIMQIGHIYLCASRVLTYRFTTGTKRSGNALIKVCNLYEYVSLFPSHEASNVAANSIWEFAILNTLFWFHYAILIRKLLLSLMYIYRRPNSNCIIPKQFQRIV